MQRLPGCLMVVWGLAVSNAWCYSGGSGTSNDPYLIASPRDLIDIADTPDDYDKCFILTADIDLTDWVFDQAVIAPGSVQWNQREPASFDGVYFTGSFNGNGHRIIRLSVVGETSLALFGALGFGSVVINLGLQEVDISGPGNCIGSLAGANVGGTIINSYSTGTVGGYMYVGGLVGYNGASVANSYSTGTVNGDRYIGGLVGSNDLDARIANSYSTSTVSGFGSYSTGTVSGSRVIGGLVGYNSGRISNCFSSGTISGMGSLGGLVGSGTSNPKYVYNSFWDMETSGLTTSKCGIGLTTAQMKDINTYLSAGWDLVDETSNGTCQIWQSEPNAYPVLSTVAGILATEPNGLGTADSPYVISSALELGSVWLRPLAAYRLEADIDLVESHWTTAVVPWFGGTFDGNGHTVANLSIEGLDDLGLFGILGDEAFVTNLGLEAVDVNGVKWSIGSLAGRNNGGIISNTYSTGVISGEAAVGGLVGRNNNGVIANSYSTSTVSGNRSVGGLVGQNVSGSISYSYSAGIVSGDFAGVTGGLVGYNGYPEGNICNSVWDKEASGLTTSDGGIGLTTAQMQDINTYQSAGWNFVGEPGNRSDDIWAMLESPGYPLFWWQVPAAP